MKLIIGEAFPEHTQVKHCSWDSTSQVVQERVFFFGLCENSFSSFVFKCVVLPQFHYSSNPSAALTWAESQGIVIPLHGCREQSRQQEQVLYSNSEGCFWGGNKKSLSFCCLILHTAPLAALLILQLSFLRRVPAATAKSGLR